MAQVRLHVELLDVSPNSLSIIYAACRQCYSAEFAGRIFRTGKTRAREQEELIRQVVASGHESPLEHVKFTFAVEGVSRTLTHQLVRHRIASYSQQSQRYVKGSSFDYIIPPSIEKDPELKGLYTFTIETIRASYDALMAGLEKKRTEGGDAREDARFILPQAVETKIVVTMNCRELLHFFEQRCCMRAQWEIRGLAEAMLAVCRKRLAAVFEKAGAKCLRLGYCPEGAGFTCGRYPITKGEGYVR